MDFSKFAPELGTVLGQKAKTLYDSSANYICPAKLPAKLKREIEETTLKAVKVLQCYDWGRLDYRYNSRGELYFLEINPLPGIDCDRLGGRLQLLPLHVVAGRLELRRHDSRDRRRRS